MRTSADNPGLPLVRWAEPGEKYYDSGEGGLFSYVFWEHKDEWDRCCVESAAQAHMTDVVVAAHGPMAEDFMGVYKYVEEVRQKWVAAKSGRSWIDFWDTPEYAYAQNIGAVGASAYLGSIPYSLTSIDGVGRFEVNFENLTKKGKHLVNALAMVYGTPTFVTYLDT